jgi:membrane dipeptidase
LREGGVDVQAFVAWPDPNEYPTTSFAQTNAMLDAFEAERAANPSDLAAASTTSEIDSVLGRGSIAGFLVVEGGHAIEDDIGKLVALYERGARYLTITWNTSTSWAVAAADSRSDSVGLSEFGRRVIRTMDSLGMIIDVSHTGIKTIEDILTVTRHPIIASHSGARALRDHFRNLTDDQIRSIARTGGVIGVVFYPPFLSGSRTVTIENVLYHINHIRGLVGVDHIALGSDFDGIERTPVGLEDVSHFPSLTRRLLELGYSREEVFKILGRNALRVIRQVCG